MRTVWKFPIAARAVEEVRMPWGAQLLTVQVQNGQPTLWAQVDSTHEPRTRRLAIIGTGHPMPELPEDARCVYVATFQLMDGDLVFHVFDLGEKRK